MTSSCTGRAGCPRSPTRGAAALPRPRRALRSLRQRRRRRASPTAGRCTGSTSAATGSPAAAAPTSSATPTSSPTSTSSAAPSSPATPPCPWCCSATAWAARSRWPTRWTTRPTCAGLVLSAPALAGDVVPKPVVPLLRALGRVAPTAAARGHRRHEDQQGPGRRRRLPGRPAGAPRQADARARAWASSASSPCCPSAPAPSRCRCCCSTARPTRSPTRRAPGCWRPPRARPTRPSAGTTGLWHEIYNEPERARAARRSAGVAGRAPLTKSIRPDISVARARGLGAKWRATAARCGPIGDMSPAAVLGEIWGTRRGDNFDQSCRPS